MTTADALLLVIVTSCALAGIVGWHLRGLYERPCGAE